MTDDSLSRGEKTRNQIVEAAFALFRDNGYHATSMRQIADRAGIAVSGIYNHFPSKEEIWKAVLLDRQPYSAILAAMNQAQGETIQVFLKDASHRMVTALQDRLDFVNLMFIELIEFDRQHLPLLLEMFFPQALAFSQRLLLAKDAYRLRPIPLPVLVRAYLGLFFSYVIAEAFLGSRLPADMRQDALDYMIEIFLFGILSTDESLPGGEHV